MKAQKIVSKISYQPIIIIWLIYASFAAFITVLPVIGPLFLGYALYQISKMGLVKNFGDIFWPSVAGVFLHGIIFQLPHWPLEIACLALLINTTSLTIGCYWPKLVS